MIYLALSRRRPVQPVSGVRPLTSAVSALRANREDAGDRDAILGVGSHLHAAPRSVRPTSTCQRTALPHVKAKSRRMARSSDGPVVMTYYLQTIADVSILAFVVSSMLA